MWNYYSTWSDIPEGRISTPPMLTTPNSATTWTLCKISLLLWGIHLRKQSAKERENVKMYLHIWRPNFYLNYIEILFRIQNRACFGVIQNFSQCHHMSLMDFVASSPGFGRSVTYFLGWDAHEAQLRCPDEVDGDIWICSNRRGLKPKFY
jgi:hypothetical protein